jgi:tetratricopeptide (TPR) repeat protein
MFALALLVLLTAAPAKAGTNADVITGVVAYQQGDYQTAISEFKSAVEDPSTLKEKYVPKAYYYLGKSFISDLSQAVLEKSERLAELEDAPVWAANAYLRARETDDGKWGESLDIATRELHPALLQQGLALLNQAGREEEEQRAQTLNRALERLEPAVLFVPDDYMGLDLRAQCFDNLGRKADAYAGYVASLEAHAAKPGHPDVLVGYTAYRAALIARYEQEDLSKALDWVKLGIARVESEYTRAESADDNLRVLYENALDDLGKFRLDIYLNTPDLRDEALGEFLAATQAEPDNYVLMVAYASMLESSDIDAAMTTYQKAIAIDPSQHIAYFNLAAVYVNRAAVLSKQENEIEDMTQATKIHESVLENVQTARPFLEKAHEISPTDLGTIRALKQVLIQLDDVEAYQIIKAKEKALTGN